MKIRIRVFMAIAIALTLSLSVFALAACGGDRQINLATPTGLRIDGQTLRWNPVENASGYIVRINEFEHEASNTYFHLPALEAGEHLLSVRARGDGIIFLSSGFSQTISFRSFGTIEGGSGGQRGLFGAFDDISRNESFLGYGFDVISSNEFSSRTVKLQFPIFDNNQLMNQRLLKVVENRSEVTGFSGSTVEEFMQSWNASLNVNTRWGGRAFGGSVGMRAHYEGARTAIESQFFKGLTIQNQAFYLVLQSDMETLRSIIAPGFARDLHDPTISPAQLFDKYGTHFITSAVMGGSITSHYYMSSQEVTSFHDVSMAIDTDIRFAVGRVSVGVEGGYRQLASNRNIHVSNSISVIGGGNFGILSDADIGENFRDWENSLHERPALIGIRDSASLWPIWELINSEEDTTLIFAGHDDEGNPIYLNRAQQLQSFFYEHGLDALNDLNEHFDIRRIPVPTEIRDIRVNNNSGEAGLNLFTAYAGTTAQITSTVYPATAFGFTMTYTIDQPLHASINNRGELTINGDTPNGTILRVTIGAGSVRETIQIRVVQTYTVIFNSLGGTNVSSQLIQHGSLVVVPDDPMRGGFVFGGWFIDMDLTIPYDFELPMVNDLTLWARWLQIHLVTFNGNGGNPAFVSQQVTQGMTATMPVDEPIRDNFVFGGWYIDNQTTTPFDFETPITNSKILFARWLTVHIVTFDVGGGSPIAPQSVAYSRLVTIPNQPTRVGFEFDGWYADSMRAVLFDFSAPIFGDTVIYAKWAPIHEIKFDSQGGSEASSIFIAQGRTVQASSIPIPTRSGYFFTGWYLDISYANRFDVNQSVMGSLILFARWSENVVTVTFDSNGGSAIQSQHVESGGRATKMIPSRDGFAFSGWFVDEGLTNPFDFDNGLTVSLTLYARWEALTFRVAFDNNGGSGSTPFVDAVFGKPMPSGAIPPTRSGFIFAGFYLFETQYYDENMISVRDWDVSSDTVLVARWTARTFAVTLNPNGGTGGIQTVIATYGQPLPAASAPTRTGYIFLGYFTHGNIGNLNHQYYNANMQGIRDWLRLEGVTLYAGWEIEWTVRTVVTGALTLHTEFNLSSNFSGEVTIPSTTNIVHFRGRPHISGSNFRIVIQSRNNDLLLIFTDFSYTAAAGLNALQSAGGSGTINIQFNGSNRLTGGVGNRNGGNGINLSNNLNISGTGHFIVQGGHGVTPATGAGNGSNGVGNGGNGGVGIIANNIRISGGSAATINIRGGDGANGVAWNINGTTYGQRGGNGGDGIRGSGYVVIGGTFTAFESRGGVGRNGSRLGGDGRNHGGDGGNGGHGITATLVNIVSASVLSFFGGHGGNGEAGNNRSANGTSGGHGGYGGHGGRAINATGANSTINLRSSTVIGGNGGTAGRGGNARTNATGGNGGRGGNGGHAISATGGSTNITVTSSTVTGGNGINGGRGGDRGGSGSVGSGGAGGARGYAINNRPASTITTGSVLTDGAVGQRGANGSYSASNCFVEGTLITLADGAQKPVEDLTGNELLLVWNFYTGDFDVAPIMFTQISEYNLWEIIQLNFSNGDSVGIVDHHGFFNITLNKFVNITAVNAHEFVGHYFKQHDIVSSEMGWIARRLDSVDVFYDYTSIWTPVTFSHLSVYANGFLSVPASARMFLNIFEVTQDTLQFCVVNYNELIQQHGLLTHYKFVYLVDMYVPEIIFHGFNVRYLLISIAQGNACLYELREIILAFEYLWMDF